MIKYKIFKRLANYFSFNTIRKFLQFNKHYLAGLFKRIDERHLFLSGAGIAFSLILSIIPFLLLLFSILVNVVDLAPVSFQVNKLIDTIIPYKESAEYLKNFLRTRLSEVIDYSTLSTYLGGFALFFTSTWLFSSMRTILNDIFGVSDDKGFFIGLLRDFAMVIIFILLILLSTVALPILNLVVSLSDSIELFSSFRLSDFSDIALSVFTFSIIFGMFYFLYYLIPYEKLGKKVPAIGALWATILWELARVIFGYYIRNFLSESKTYGAFIIIMIVLFWLFYASMIFIVGAEIAQLYRERKLEKEEKIMGL